MSRIGEKLAVAGLFATGIGSIATGAYLQANPDINNDARAAVCSTGLDRQGQIDCITEVATSRGVEEAMLYGMGSALIIAGAIGAVKIGEDTKNDERHLHPVK